MLQQISNILPKDNIGIVALQIYFPKKYVDQAELEQFDNVSTGKYTIGLGQLKMACCDDREDINSIALSVVSKLFKDYNISPKDIGRLEVGTETIIDKSKSVKTVLMQLFADYGNSNVEGCDTTNACYGGTNALFNTINWIESSSWDGRYGLVVAGDIAVYKSGAARPTGGAGVVAMLIGPNAPLVFDIGQRVSHMEHVWDFYKPDLNSEYPEVDGALSNECYIKSVDICYNRFVEKFAANNDVECTDINVGDFYCFHSPYTKLVQKSFARVLYNDFLRCPKAPQYAHLQHLLDVSVEKSFTNKEIEKSFMELTKKQFEEKVLTSLTGPKNIGNMYCGSLYSGLCSLISGQESSELQGKRIVLFSYGSGLAASMFSLKVVGSTDQMKSCLNIEKRLEKRSKISPEQFETLMCTREEAHGKKGYTPSGVVDAEGFFTGSWYLDTVDEKYRRSYKQFE